MEVVDNDIDGNDDAMITSAAKEEEEDRSSASASSLDRIDQVGEGKAGDDETTIVGQRPTILCQHGFVFQE